MTQGHGLYDGVSASGDASNRLIDRAEVAPVDPAVIPDYKDLTPFLQSPANNTVNGYHYGISHGWGGNTLMYSTKSFTTPPTSWDAVFDPAKMAGYKGKVTAYGGSIYLADAALYLKTHKPELGITDPYELTQEQFDAAVALLKEQRPFVGKYWTLVHRRDRQLHQRHDDRSARPGRTRPTPSRAPTSRSRPSSRPRA